MGQSTSLFLVRAAGMLLAGLLLFALFGHAHAQSRTDNYGLTRFPGDNYDTIPPGAGIAPPPVPPQSTGQGYQQMPGTAVGPNGTYSRLNGGTSVPQNYPGDQTQSYPGYQAVPQQPMAPLRQAQDFQPPQAQLRPSQLQPEQQSAQPVQDTYGYKPLPPIRQAPQQPVQAQQPPVQQAAQPVQPQMPAQPSGYRQTAAQPPVQAPAPQAPRVANAANNATGSYVLGPGDKLKLTVYGETDLSGEFTIDGSGFARLPLIGQVRAAGYTAQQLEQVVANTLAQGYLKSPRVAVEVTTYRPFYVIGAVNRPGQYPYVEHMNALNAIALAGGFNPSAVESVIFIRREGSNREEEAPVDRTTIIYPGDVIKVHNTIFADITGWIAPLSGVAASAATAAIIQ
jgi:polysaccharide export outer membrane protein